MSNFDGHVILWVIQDANISFFIEQVITISKMAITANSMDCSAFFSTRYNETDLFSRRVHQGIYGGRKIYKFVSPARGSIQVPDKTAVSWRWRWIIGAKRAKRYSVPYLTRTEGRHESARNFAEFISPAEQIAQPFKGLVNLIMVKEENAFRALLFKIGPFFSIRGWNLFAALSPRATKVGI